MKTEPKKHAETQSNEEVARQRERLADLIAELLAHRWWESTGRLRAASRRNPKKPHPPP